MRPPGLYTDIGLRRVLLPDLSYFQIDSVVNLDAVVEENIVTL